MKIEPLEDRIVVEPMEAESKTRGGIVLPDTAQEKPQKGKVVATGPGRMLDTGKRAAPAVKKGDTVVYARYGGTEIEVDGKEYMILRESDLLAIIG
jgi:chaperonin GroES